MVKAGIVDPVKVRSALENAAGIASLLLTTECLVGRAPRRRETNAHYAARGMGGMDY